MDRLEILVVDGMSEDGTRDIASEYGRKSNSIRLIDNPKGILASAWNLGIQHSKGEVIFAMNAHAKTEPGYFVSILEHLVTSGADCVGPMIETHPQDEKLFGKLISTALSHPFGVGNSRFRTGVTQPTFVDTVHMGAYRRTILNRVGPFDERLVRSQDIDFNRRLKRVGGKILLVPDVRVHYYTRSSPKEFLRYGFINGYWASRPYSFGANVAGARHLIPSVFVMALVLPLHTLRVGTMVISTQIIVISAYILVAVTVSIKLALKERDGRYAILLPFVFFLIHVPYGIGCLAGLVQAVCSIEFWKRIVGSPRMLHNYCRKP